MKPSFESDIVNGAADFTGTNGCYLYQGRDIPDNKDYNLKDHILVIAPHEGLISLDLWLQCRKRLLTNSGFAGTHETISGYFNNWDSIGFEDRRFVALLCVCGPILSI